MKVNKPLKFKVGDKVRVNCPAFTTLHGKKGVIRGFGWSANGDQQSEPVYRVEMNMGQSVFYERTLELIEKGASNE